MELACSPFELGCSEYSIVSEGYAAWPLHARVYGTCTPSGQRLEKSTPHGLAVKKSAPTKEEHARRRQRASTSAESKTSHRLSSAKHWEVLGGMAAGGWHGALFTCYVSGPSVLSCGAAMRGCGRGRDAHSPPFTQVLVPFPFPPPAAPGQNGGLASELIRPARWLSTPSPMPPPPPFFLCPSPSTPSPSCAPSLTSTRSNPLRTIGVGAEAHQMVWMATHALTAKKLPRNVL